MSLDSGYRFSLSLCNSLEKCSSKRESSKTNSKPLSHEMKSNDCQYWNSKAFIFDVSWIKRGERVTWKRRQRKKRRQREGIVIMSRVDVNLPLDFNRVSLLIRDQEDGEKYSREFHVSFVSSDASSCSWFPVIGTPFLCLWLLTETDSRERERGRQTRKENQETE